MNIINYDSFLELFTIRIDNEIIVSAKKSPSDNWMVFEYNKDKQIVGIEVLKFKTYKNWLNHPDRNLIPLTLLESMDSWQQSALTYAGQPV